MTAKDLVGLVRTASTDLPAKKSKQIVNRLADLLGFNAVQQIQHNEAAYLLDRFIEQTKDGIAQRVAQTVRSRLRPGTPYVPTAYQASPRRYPLVSPNEAWEQVGGEVRIGRNNELLRKTDDELVAMVIDAIGDTPWSVATLLRVDRILVFEVQRRGGLAWLRPLLGMTDKGAEVLAKYNAEQESPDATRKGVW